MNLEPVGRPQPTFPRGVNPPPAKRSHPPPWKPSHTDTHMEYALILLGGLLGSSHCVGMCGGFALSIGVISGTYSTIFVACPTVLLLKHKRNKAAAENAKGSKKAKAVQA